MTDAPGERLQSWGRASVSRSVRIPIAGAPEAVRSAGRAGVIARGLGRSYGDACLNDGGCVVDACSAGRVRRFDPETGVLEADAGLSFDALTELVLPAGWLPPVAPGTAYVTLGGAFANDVHGKNHGSAGSFCAHVDWIDLLLPDGTTRRVTPEGEPVLWRASAGGLGLTGIILALRLRLRRVPGGAVELEERRCASLAETIAAVTVPAPEWEYAVAWLDLLASGSARGRGVIERARHVGAPVGGGRRWSVPVPPIVPDGLLRPATLRAFNAWYHGRIPGGGRRRTVPVRSFLYPLDRLRDWHRLYGPRGLLQFQCVVPFPAAGIVLPRLADDAAASGLPALAVLKRMEGDGVGALSFPCSGLSLAIDFPNAADARALVRRLYRIAAEHGGRAYLAKDACLERDVFERMYPAAGEFRAVRRALDPEDRLQSDMARRLGLVSREAPTA